MYDLTSLYQLSIKTFSHPLSLQMFPVTPHDQIVGLALLLDKVICLEIVQSSLTSLVNHHKSSHITVCWLLCCLIHNEYKYINHHIQSNYFCCFWTRRKLILFIVYIYDNIQKSLSCVSHIALTVIILELCCTRSSASSFSSFFLNEIRGSKLDRLMCWNNII